MEKDIWIYAHYNQYSKETEYQIFAWERSEDTGDVLLERRSISFDTPNDKELRVQLSHALERKLRATRAQHLVEQNEILETINELRSLEFKGEAA
jgi:hypothetical protein